MSKEEIEKAKERLMKQAVTSKAGCEDYPNCICMKKDLIIALNYIDQLKQENNKQNKIIYEMAKNIYERLYNEKKLPIAKNKDYYNCNVESVKQYFEKKVEEK